MNPLLLTVLVLSLFVFDPIACAQPRKSPDEVWTESVPFPAVRNGRKPVSSARAFKTHQLNLGRLKALLARAPMQFTPKARTAPAEITLPMPDGTFARFAVEETPLIAGELSPEVRDVKTFRGRGLDDRSASLRMDLTRHGFHAMIISSRGTVYIDPYDYADEEYCISYNKADAVPTEPFKCITDDNAPANRALVLPRPGTTTDELSESATEPVVQPIEHGTVMRTYRLAVAATAQYTAFHTNKTMAMNAIVTAVNRITGIYERELAISFVLVGHNGQFVYTDAGSDPFTESNTDQVLNANQQLMDNVLGNANYDIAHVFGRNISSAAMYGVCQTGIKAKGATGRSDPIGDPFVVDYVAHEMGHQFTASHTFNAFTGSCTSNRVSTTAYEPGSGTTIMGYAGICTVNDVQPNSDAYFHSASLQQIHNYTTPGVGLGDCPTGVSTGNNAPNANAGLNRSVPINTPFMLTGSGSDPDGDSISFCWEGRDLGPSQDYFDPDNGSSPLFRSYYPTDGSSTRVFPRNALRGTNTAIGEKLPTLARTMDFRLTVRDQSPIGAFATDDMAVTVVATGGPFAVSYPSDGGAVWPAGTYQEVSWSVANTDVAPFNESYVKIHLSIDDGVTYPFELANITANDGSERIRVPFLTNNFLSCRIKVQAYDGIFFDVSDLPFRIDAAAIPANDNVANAFYQGFAPSGQVTGKNINATSELGEPMHWFGSGPAYLGVTHSVWYKWTPNEGGTVSVHATSDDMFPIVAVYEAGSSWGPIALPKLGQAQGSNSITFSARKFQTYYMAVDGLHEQSFGTFILHRTMVVDSTPPTIGFSPLTNQQPVFNFSKVGGSVSEAATVTFKIEEFVPGGPNMFWNGTNWSSIEFWLPATVSGNTWTPEGWTLPSRGQTRPYSYVVHAKAVDPAGNVGQENIVLVRTPPDTTPPILTISTPGQGEVYTNNYLPQFVGTAVDPESGVASVVALLSRTTANGQLFWSGSAWGEEPVNLPVCLNPDGTWTSGCGFNLPSGPNLPNTGYTITLGASNNEEPTSGSASVGCAFSVDYHPVHVWTAGSYWDGVPGNDNDLWSNGANWDVGVPGDDAIVIVNSGHVDSRLNGNVTMYAIQQNGGHLDSAGFSIKKRMIIKGDVTTGAGSLVISSNAACSWEAGRFDGTLQVQPAANLVINSPGGIHFGSGAIDNAGSITWTNVGNITGSGGASITNRGLFMFDGKAKFIYNGSGSETRLVNMESGILRQTRNTTNTFENVYGGWIIDNHGTIDVQAGALEFLSQTKVLRDGGRITGSGRILSAAGVLTVAGTTTFTNGLVRVLDTLTGSGAFTGNGTLQWSEGEITTPQFTNGPGMTLLIDSNATKKVSQTATIYQEGTVIVAGNGPITVNRGSKIANSGSFEVRTNVSINYDGWGSQGTFDNLPGAVFRTTTTNIVNFSGVYGGVGFRNLGLVDVQAGTLNLGGGGAASSGEYRVNNGALLQLTSETLTVVNGACFTGGGLTRVTGGTLNGDSGPGDITLSGTLELSTDGTLGGTGTWIGNGTLRWNAGTIVGRMNIGSGVTMNIVGNASRVLSGGAIVNFGTVNWVDNATWTLNNGGAFTNRGTFLASGNGEIAYNGSGAYAVFENAAEGTFRKTGNTTTTFNTVYGGVPFHNRGTLDIQEGVLSMHNDSKYFYEGGTISGAGRVRNSIGTLTLAGMTTMAGGTLELAADLNGSGGFTGTGTFEWFSGAIKSNSRLTNDINVLLLVSGSGNKSLTEGSALTQMGSSTVLDSGSLLMNYGAQLFNYGAFEIRTNTTFSYNGNGAEPVFNNMPGGVIRKVTPTSATFPNAYGGIHLINNGMIDVQDGALRLGGGGGPSIGRFHAEAGTVVEFTDDTHIFGPGAQITGAGFTRLRGGRVDANSGLGSIILDGTFEVSTNGTLGGTATWIGGGTMNWNSGTLNAGIHFGPNLTMNITGSQGKVMAAGYFVNNGVVNWSGTGDITMYNGAALTNRSLLHLQATTGSITYNGTGGWPIFCNDPAGTLRRTGVGTTTFASTYSGVEFRNYGTLEIQSGILAVNSATKVFHHAGSISGAGRVKTSNGACTFAGAHTFDGGRLEIASGATGAGLFNGDGTIEWSGGNIFSAAVTNAAQFAIVSGDPKLMSNTSWRQEGNSMVTDGGGATLNNGTLFVNAGIFEVTNSFTIGYDGAGAYPMFRNLGTFRKTGTTSATTFSSSYSGVTFENLGKIDIRNGSVALNSPHTSSPSAELLLSIGGGSSSQFGRQTGSGILNGGLTVTLTNNFIPTNGQTFNIVTYSSRNGQFNATNLPALPSPLKWKLTYGSTAVQLAVERSHVLGAPRMENGTMRLQFDGPSATRAILQTSTNLSDWTPAFTNSPFTGTFLFSDPNTAGMTNKFYRIQIEP